jgi:MSHA pilin protein MshC
MARRHGAGFSMVELIVTISIIGLLAAFTIPRFVSIQGFDSRGFHDEAIGVVRYAQKTAIAWRRTVFVCVTATEIRVGTASGCAAAIVHPTKESGQLTATAPSGVTLASVAEFSFNGIGRPSAATTITFSSTIAGDPPRRIVVEAETGYVHP